MRRSPLSDDATRVGRQQPSTSDDVEGDRGEVDQCPMRPTGIGHVLALDAVRDIGGSAF